MEHQTSLLKLDRIDVRTGRPCLNWDDQKWQDFFAMLKTKILPTPAGIRKMQLPALDIKDNENYQGNTNYQNYCRYINDVLFAIRHGQNDFCYFIYQIADLYRYEPNLKTQLCNGDKLSPYIRVWLEKEDFYGTR